MDRRRLLLGMTSLLAAPTIVRASSLMAISPIPAIRVETLRPYARWVINLHELSAEEMIPFTEEHLGKLPYNIFSFKTTTGETIMYKISGKPDPIFLNGLVLASPTGAAPVFPA